MAWFSMQDASGRGWAFDPDGAAHVIRSSQYNRQLVLRSRRIERSHGFLLPTTYEIETNFTNIRGEVQQHSQGAIAGIDRAILEDPRRLYEWLVHVREDGEIAGNAHRRLLSAASRDTAQAIDSNVNGWENALAAAKFVRDTSAGILFAGATVLSGGAALAVGAGATGLTFVGGTEDNLEQNQTMRQAMGNAAISTSFAVVTSLLVPRALSAIGQGITGVAATGAAARTLTMGENVVLGLISIQVNIAADIAKTALTADTAAGTVAAQAAAQMQRQIGARSGFEITSMLFSSWLASRGIPASAILDRNAGAASSVVGGLLGAVGDRLVAAVSQQGTQGRGNPLDLDMAFTRIAATAAAEQYVRESAMFPV